VLSLLLVREREELVRQALAKLPPADAEVLALKYGERWSCREMARRLGITEKAVECRLARARARLRNLLADFLISDP
jgi:RNA polymerase sigma-70 factor (ECF subfamily)